MTKGLELSKKYYTDYAKQIFDNRFESIMERVAVGLAGPGSECLGFDDEHSRDHDWGPCFCLWLTLEDFQQYGEEFQDCYDSLSKTFNGFGPRKVSQGETGREGPMVIEDFYRRYTGLHQPPKTLKEWNIPSENMVLCTNGEIFFDPLGIFTQWRNSLLKFYPEDLRLKKIADCCMHAGQAGQYNWQRGILRGDPFSIFTAKINFCTEILKMIFLLNKQYAPYYKWLFKGAEQLPVLGTELSPHIKKFLMNTERDDQQEIITQICTRVVAALQDQNITDSDQLFLIDHVPSILSRITDSDYRKNLWGGK